MLGCLALACLLPAAATAEPPQPSTETLPEPAKENPPPTPVPPAPVAVEPAAECGPACAPPAKTLSLPGLALSQESHAITVPVLTLREETIGVVSGMAFEYPRDKRVKQMVTIMEPIKQKITKDFVVTEMVPVTVTDDCGKCHTEYQPCQTVKQIQEEVVVGMACKEVPVEVDVPVLKPAQLFQVKRLVLDVSTQAAVENRLQLHTIPNEVAVPPAPCPALPPPLPH
jgi:hypothetical protein